MYTPAEGEAASAARADQGLIHAEHDDPDTPKRIAALAAQLIAERPRAAEPIVVEVTTPARRRSRELQGSAVAYRAWPVGNLEYSDHRMESSGAASFAVNASGALVLTSDDLRLGGPRWPPVAPIGSHDERDALVRPG